MNGEPVPFTIKAEMTTHVLLLPSADFLFIKREASGGLAAAIGGKDYDVSIKQQPQQSKL